MKVKAAVQYYIKDMRKAIAIYYLIVVVLSLGFVIFFSALASTLTIGTNDVTGNISGFEVATMTTLFVFGLNSFKSNFQLFLQNGMCRKTLFAGISISTAAIGGFMALVDTSLGGISYWLAEFLSHGKVRHTNLIYATFYTDIEYKLVEVNPVYMWITIILWMFVAYVAAMLLGYLITILYYRMNKAAKIIVSISVPVFFCIILPVIADMFHRIGVVLDLVKSKIFWLLLGNIERSIGVILVGSIIEAIIIFLMVRHVEMKRITD